MTIQLYNTLSKSIEEFKPLREDEVRIYSCGPTVYDHAHIGNMRAFLFSDLLQRVMRVVGGYKVQWVMNITDIDDKTIRNSSTGGGHWRSEMGEQSQDALKNLRLFTDYFSKLFADDISTLGIRVDHFKAMPRATDYIAQMQDLIRKIFDKGFAYVAEGSVYFDLSKWRKGDSYGKLFNVDFGNFREGVRIDADEYERESVSDFVLWKATKVGEPFWSFELNGEQLSGRPGWHIECSAMGYDLLGLPFDIHTGGVDLRFPHHEDEIAQSKAGYGVEPARFWCHNEFLEVEGKKMSKSLGNYFTLRDLIQRGYDALDIRFAMMSSHYSSVYNFTFDGLAASAKARARVQDYIYDLVDAHGQQQIDASSIRHKVFSALADNLHTPKALAELFAFINNSSATDADQSSRAELLKLFEELNGIFAVWNISKRPEAEAVPEAVLTLAQQRLDAKKQKNYMLADELRLKVEALGYLIRDTKDGFDLEKR